MAGMCVQIVGVECCLYGWKRERDGNVEDMKLCRIVGARDREFLKAADFPVLK